jgi:hypothetical protein
MNAQWSLYSSRARFRRFVSLAVLLGLGVASPCAVTAAPNAGAGVVGAAAHDVSNITAVRARVSSGAARITGSAGGSRGGKSHHRGSHGGTAVQGHHGAVHGG